MGGTCVAVQYPRSVSLSRYGRGEVRHHSVPSRLEGAGKLSLGSCEHSGSLVKTFQLNISGIEMSQSPKGLPGSQGWVQILRRLWRLITCVHGVSKCPGSFHRDVALTTGAKLTEFNCVGRCARSEREWYVSPPPLFYGSNYIIEAGLELCYVAQTCLRLIIFLFQPPECWSSRHVSSPLAPFPC